MPIDHDSLKLSTESDVEQKVIMPLLNEAAYLDIPSDRIFTKGYMAPTALDKTAGRASGYVLTNIFKSDPDWQKPDNFLLVEILFFLARNRKHKGEIGLEGYFTCRRVTEELQRLGYVPEDVLGGLNVLLRKELIGAGHMNFDKVGLDDCVRILASGFIHVRILVGRMEYLYGIIPTTPIFEPEIGAQLAEFVRLESERGTTTGFQRVRAVEMFFQYLSRQQQANSTPFSNLRETGAAYVLKHISGAIQDFRNITKGTPETPDALDF